MSAFVGVLLMHGNLKLFIDVNKVAIRVISIKDGGELLAFGRALALLGFLSDRSCFDE